jgi:hypothetical protein
LSLLAGELYPGEKERVKRSSEGHPRKVDPGKSFGTIELLENGGIWYYSVRM